MSWILLEGLDRSGKSTVAEYYKGQGYEVVHMSAPDKRHFEPGYAGPSYLEELVEMYSIYKGKNVVFDRTPYGELVWPEIFNRMPLLNEEDIEYLASLEYHEDVERYLLFDEDTEAHWKRCIDNSEPINRVQFVQAGRLYDKLSQDKGFIPKQLGDFSLLAEDKSVQQQGVSADESSPSEDGRNVDSSRNDKADRLPNKTNERTHDQLSTELRLERANAIRSILSTKIIKKKGKAFEKLEQDIQGFLHTELEKMFGNEIKEDTFTEDEVQILKSMVKRIQEKME